MTTLKDISGAVPLELPQRSPTRNALPLLHEIRHALHRLLESGEQTVIDLRALPLTGAEQEQILAVLGTGEVEAHLEALGKSVVRETRCAGVWVVEHYDVDDEIMGRQIEVTRMPFILYSQEEDMRAGLVDLEIQLAAIARDGPGASRED